VIVRKLKSTTPASTACSTFEQGKTRQLDVVIHPDRVFVKARGLKGWRVVTWGSIYLHAVAAAADFDPSPRDGKLKRGR
jgi:hypothetical protein